MESSILTKREEEAPSILSVEERSIIKDEEEEPREQRDQDYS